MADVGDSDNALVTMTTTSSYRAGILLVWLLMTSTAGCGVGESNAISVIICPMAFGRIVDLLYGPKERPSCGRL